MTSCDKCCAEALVTVSFHRAQENIRVLLFCGHHYRRYEASLKALETCVIIIDTAKLTQLVRDETKREPVYA